MKLFFLFPMLLCVPSAFAEFKLKFTYEDSEMMNVLPCTHERIRDLPDWKVNCGGKQKTYTAHVIARKGDRQNEPQTTMEILYWVTEPGETPTSIRKYHSTSALIHMKQRSDINDLILSQGVENDMASLRMEITDFP